MNIPTSIPREDQELIRELLNDKPDEFTDLKQTQREAFEQGLLSNDNHLLVAHTGNGKTLCAEAVAKKSLKENKNVAYLVPSRSLVNDKHEDIEGWAPDTAKVEKASGYNSANIIVATFESYFEAVIRGYSERFETVILDDFHEIYDDSHRGPTIEKGIAAALDQNSQVFAMSATVGNPETIASWINARLTVSSESRAVPIKETPIEKTDSSYATQIANIIEENPDKGPFIVFCDTTRNVESRAIGVADSLSFSTPDDINFRDRVKKAISTELTDDHEELITALQNGVGYHHSQMEPKLKEEIANLAENGDIKCVTATTSLSYGFNSPVQSVITADLKRYTREQGRTHIGKYEYIQMVGRAGRDDTVYHQAYAFPMFDDDETKEVFQFDTDLENKDIEGVTTHLDDRERLRWLLLELINYGWETKEEIVDFLTNTLYWEEKLQKYGGDQKYAKAVAEEMDASITTQLEWLLDRGVINKEDASDSREKSILTVYSSTEIGDAIVEYHHSNWFDNTVEQVHNLAKWMRTEIQNETLTAEQLVEHLANKYHYCEHSVNTSNTKFLEKMAQHGLSGDAGETAAVICWYWCHGYSIEDIESITDTNSQSRLPSTAYNISTAVDSLSELFKAETMPSEPNWISSFQTHIDTGVSGVDAYFMNTTNMLGRKRYYNIANKFDRMKNSDETDYGSDAFLIEQLYEFSQDHTPSEFIDVITKGVDDVGRKVAQEVRSTVEDWRPTEHIPVAVPYEYIPREFSETRYEQSPHTEQTGDKLRPEQETGADDKKDEEKDGEAVNQSLGEYV